MPSYCNSRQTLPGAIVAKAGAFPGPVLFLVPSGFSYVAVQWGIWLAGGIAVPVHTAHPAEEMAYLVQDTGTRLLICTEALAAKAREAVVDPAVLITLDQLSATGKSDLPEVGHNR